MWTDKARASLELGSMDFAVQEISDLADNENDKESGNTSSEPANSKRIRLAMFSSGLGKINRGFEVSTARLFRSIKDSQELDVRLFAGADYPETEKVWCINRNDWLRFPLGLMPFVERERLWRLAYILEQSSFCFGLLRDACCKWQPEVVWTKEVPLAHVLYEFRHLSGNHYKIIFANGGGFNPKTYRQFDFIQHLHPDAYEEAINAGIPAVKMNVLPNLVPMAVPSKSKADLRAEFGYDSSDYVIICVAAWNRHHKRLDYLIEEVARADIPGSRLLICGEPEPESEALFELARKKLGERARFMTVSEESVIDLLHLSDLFVLCSFYEGLGAVMIEAALAGLPVISHPHGGSRYILQDERWLVDMSSPGRLADALRQLHDQPPAEGLLAELKEKVLSRFQPEKIAAEFENMVKAVYGPQQQLPESQQAIRK